MRIKTTRLIMAITAVFAILACESVRRTDFLNLQGQGILALSSSNAYLGTNLLIAKEAEQSRYLYNFLSDRGAPKAIEFNDGGKELIMFYPKKKEAYKADFNEKEWIIRGPFSISRKDYRYLKALALHESGEPLFELWGKKKRFKINPGGFQGHYRVNIIPTPKPVVKKVKAKPKPTPSIDIPEGPMNFDQRALSMSNKRPKKKRPGDITHKVKKTGQSWDKIVEWYTKSQNLTEIIKKLNPKVSKDNLQIGEEIKIPGVYVKQRKPMP